METRTLIGLGALGAVGVAAWILWPREGSGSGSDGGSKPPPSKDGSGNTGWTPDPKQVARACDLGRQKTSLEANRAQLVVEQQSVYSSAYSLCNNFASPCIGGSSSSKSTTTEWRYTPNKGGTQPGDCTPPSQQTSVLRCRQYVDGTAAELPYGGSSTQRASLEGLRAKMAQLKQGISTTDSKLKAVNDELAKLTAQKIVCKGGS